MKNVPQLKLYSLNESSVTIALGNEIGADTFQRLSHFNEQINKQPFEGFVNTVQAYTTLTVFFDLVSVAKSSLIGERCCDKVKNYLHVLLSDGLDRLEKLKSEVVIPVCYDPSFGIDLQEISAFKGITVNDLISIHTSTVYQVYMIGFLPGFPYMGGLDSRLHMARKISPRTCIPAGSVGVAGQQTGVYPLDSPGGWQIIGRTPLKMFSIDREEPSLLKAGDTVRFERIDRDTFYQILGEDDAN